MSELLVVFVGSDWPAKAEPLENVHVKADCSKPFADYADDICKQLGVGGADDVCLFQGKGMLPDVECGNAVQWSSSPTDEGFVPPELGKDDEQMCVIYVKKNDAEATKEAPAANASEAAAEAAPKDEVTPGLDAGKIAGDIFAAVDGLGTNEDAIYEAAGTVKSNADWKAVLEAFRSNHPDCNGGDMLVALKEDLSESEMAKLVEILNSSNISIDGTGDGAAGAAVAGDTKCPDCDNYMSQPFCGNTGKPHVMPGGTAAAGAGAGALPGQFSSDRACTQCGDGMLGEEPKQACFVCIDCDGKFCERCWEFEHRNKKRAHHKQYLLFYECDLCPQRGGEAKPALWYCDTCKLLLCKQCWHDEHKNPARRAHVGQFLYPGSENGPFQDVTVDAQQVVTASSNFNVHEYGTFVASPADRVCTICADSTRPAIFKCAECDSMNPEMLCADCWQIEHRMPNRRAHKKHLILFPCDICQDVEGRPAIASCSICQLKLCGPCWELEHRNPERHGHVQEPLYNDIPNTEVQAMLQNVAQASNSLPVQNVANAPVLTMPPKGAVMPSGYTTQSQAQPLLTPDPLTPGRSYYSPERHPQQYDGYTNDTTSMLSQQQQTDRFHHYRQRLARFYQVYNPSKLPSVSSCLKEYRGYEEDLLAALVRRYGPEPAEDTSPLPPGWRLVESTRGDLFYIHTDGRKQWQRPVI